MAGPSCTRIQPCGRGECPPAGSETGKRCPQEFGERGRRSGCLLAAPRDDEHRRVTPRLVVRPVVDLHGEAQRDADQAFPSGLPRPRITRRPPLRFTHLVRLPPGNLDQAAYRPQQSRIHGRLSPNACARGRQLFARPGLGPAPYHS